MNNELFEKITAIVEEQFSLEPVFPFTYEDLKKEYEQREAFFVRQTLLGILFAPYNLLRQMI